MKWLAVLFLFLPLGCSMFQTKGSTLMLQLEAIKAQERLMASQLMALDKANDLIDKARLQSGPIAEIETDETGRSHVKVFPQGQERLLMEMVEKIALNSHQVISGLHIEAPQLPEGVSKDLIEKGHDLARTGILGWIARELLGIFVHGPNWQWTGDGMVD